MSNQSKNIIVTGANGGLGTAIVQRLIEEKFSLILFDNNNSQLESFSELALKNDTLLKFFTFDISNPTNIKEIFQQLESEYDSIFGLVNNVGIYPIKRLEEYTLELWHQVVDVNLTSAFLCTQLVLPFMKKAGGKIINIASTGAHLGSRDPGYSSSKAGLIGLTKSCARNLSQYNIQVNAIAPGMIDTQMSRRMRPEDRQKNVEMSLVRRMGIPTDVSGVVQFLLSSDSDYINGFTIDVNGGMYIR